MFKIITTGDNELENCGRYCLTCALLEIPRFCLMLFVYFDEGVQQTRPGIHLVFLENFNLRKIRAWID